MSKRALKARVPGLQEAEGTWQGPSAARNMLVIQQLQPSTWLMQLVNCAELLLPQHSAAASAASAVNPANTKEAKAQLALTGVW
jgi:hypothetical protein